MNDPREFVRRNTALLVPPLVPEIRLHLATELVPMWQKTEEELEAGGVPPPYWAFAWAGGQALARYILDNPDAVAGRHVLDFGSGSGLVAIAAAKANAARVRASDIDPFARAAISLNAIANEVTVEVLEEDLIGSPRSDVILVGDVCYEMPLAGTLLTWLRSCAARGSNVLLGDPGRSYFPKSGVQLLATYSVETTRELEDSTVRMSGVYRLASA